MRVKPLIRNFTAGEIAPQLDGLLDGSIQGCRTLENFIVRKQGGVERRPGTKYAGAVKTASAQTRIIPFQSTTGVWYIIELGNLYARFWKVSTHAVMGGVGAETEVTTVFTTAQLRDVKYVVIKDSIYFTHPSHPVQRLTWTADTTWTWEQAPISSANRIIAVGYYKAALTSFVDNINEIWDSLMPNFLNTSNYGILCVGYGNGIWVMGAIYDLSISYDGRTWTSIPRISSYQPHCITFANNIFMVGCSHGYVWFGSNGTDWTEVSIGEDTTILDTAYKKSSHRWLVGTAAGSNYYSDDGGNSWTVGASLDFGGEARTVCYGNDVWVAAGENGDLATSVDVTSLWSSVSSGTAEALLCARWIEPLGTFVLTGASGVILTSSTGAAWASMTSGVTDDLYSIAWTGSQVLVASDAGTLLTSQDAVTWTEHEVDDSVSFRWIAVDYNYGEAKGEDFNQANHYPRACAYHEGRLILADTINDPNMIWGSGTNAPNAFRVGVYDSDPWDMVLGGSKQSRVLWAESASSLIIGTDEREGIIIGGDAGITASNRRLLWQSTYGSDDALQGLLINDAVIFAQRNATIVRALRYQQTEQPPIELTYLADHIAVTSTGEGIVEWDHQKTPESIIWAIRDDGQLLSLSYDPGLGLNAWARHPTRSGDTWESVAVTGGSLEDSIWLVAVRSINGSTVRYIEYMDTRYFASLTEAHFVDCGFEDTIATNQFTGLTALEGETVDVLTNGNVVSTNSVASGIITFTSSVASQIVHVGLAYDSTLQTTRLRTGSAWGENVGLKINIPKIYAWFYESLGGKIGPTETNTSSISYNSSSSLTTDLVEVNLPSYHNEDGYLWVIQDDPLPMTLLALSPEVKMGER